MAAFVVNDSGSFALGLLLAVRLGAALSHHRFG
jgi:hypothetical protein